VRLARHGNALEDVTQQVAVLGHLRQPRLDQVVEAAGDQVALHHLGHVQQRFAHFVEHLA
jgi:hypothetical protein